MHFLAQRLASACIALSVFAGGTPCAAEWPTQQLTFLQPYGPGTALDAVTRLMAKQIGARWNVPIVVENRAGANGVIGTEAVVRGKADGSVFLFTGPGQFTNELLLSKLPYDSQRDFKPVARLASVMLVLVVPTSSPFNSVQELITYAKQNPMKLTYSSGGSGSSASVGRLVRKHGGNQDPARAVQSADPGADGHRRRTGQLRLRRAGNRTRAVAGREAEAARRHWA